MNGVFVRVVSAIVVTVAEPIGFNADVGLLAFEVVGWAGGVGWAALVGLVGCAVVLTIIHSITDLSLRYATSVLAGELTISTRRVLAIDFVGSILAVILVIAFP